MAALALLLLASGIVVTALPDSGERLFSFSDEHGPSALDAAGIGLVLAGWLLLAREVWRRRPPVSRRAAAAAAVATAAGAMVLAAAIAAGGPAWIAGVALLAAPQAALAVRALAPPRHRRVREAQRGSKRWARSLRPLSSGARRTR